MDQAQLDRAQLERAGRPLVKPSPAGGKPRTLGGITVLIPAYNEAAFVADTVRSVQAQTVHIDQIIVIDDASSDGTGDVARACGEEVIVVRPERNCGSKATALNFGLSFTTSEYTLAIDADTTLAPDAVEKLMKHFDAPAPSATGGPATPRVAAVCGMVVPRNVSTIWERGRYVEYLYAFTFYKPIQDWFERPLIASGCFTAFRTDVLRRLGGWSTRTVGEDMDLTWSVYRLGMGVKFAADAVCRPVEPHNWHFLSKQLKRWTAGFAQCVKVHWADLLEMPFMRSMVAVAMWDAVIAAVAMFVLVPLMAIFVHPIFLMMYLLDLPAIAVPVLVAGAKRGEFVKALTSLPAFWVLRFVNAYFVIRAFWNEFVAGRRLHTFEKGH
ncbi:MAG: glycosyltransferase family 2 protein [Planctomycetota bacterium]|nr:glycosyltransferase family 2 protein [Planctomycetota bacterium]